MNLTHLDILNGRQSYHVGSHYDGQKYFLRYRLSGLTEMRVV